MIRTIRVGRTNCYLLTADSGFVLVDSGTPRKRKSLDAALARAGCRPGSLRLVVLTHGDYAHAGNAAYLRDKFATKIAMHPDDSVRVERADWSWNLKPKPDRFVPLFKVVTLLGTSSKFDTFTPDVLVRDQESLGSYGLRATVLHLPGHTKGSIGILAGRSDVFCGDLMDSMGNPSLEFFIDDMAAARASLKRLRRLGADWIYPGHGRPFRLSRIADDS
jgi:hydroxyacylglutathione hydrolase